MSGNLGAVRSKAKSGDSISKVTDTQQSFGWQLAASACLAIVTFLLYLQTCWFPFLDFDDLHFVVRNPDVQGGLTAHGIWQAWTTATEGNWTPLTWMSFMLNISLFGQEAGSFHAVNMLLHSANTVLLYWFLSLITGRRGRSFAVALLFGVHPLHVESVAWVVERRDVLFLFWTLITVILYQSYAKRPAGWKYAATTLTFALALISKSMAVTVPVLMLLLDYWPLERWKKVDGSEPSSSVRRWRWLIVEKLPWLGLSLLTGVITILAQHQSGSTRLNFEVTFLAKCVNAVNALRWYLEKTFWPTDLCVLYDHPLNNWDLQRTTVSQIVIVLITGWAIWNYRRRPYLLTGWLWFLIALMPVIGILQVGKQAYADRYTYLPQIGLGIMIIWQMCDLLERFYVGKRLEPFLLVIFAIFYAGLTGPQIGVWQDSPSLWAQVLKVNPDQVLANFKAGEWQLLTHNYDGAIAGFRRALELKGDEPAGWRKLGTAYEKTGDLDRAMEAYQQAAALDPNHPLAYKQLGMIYQQKGDTVRAKEMLIRAGKLDTTDPELRNRLGFLVGSEGDVPLALQLFEEAVKIAPADFMSRMNLGMALNHQGRTAEALVHLSKAVQLDPGNPAARFQLATALEVAGQRQQAVLQYIEALKLNPADAAAKERLDALLNQR